MRGTITKAAVAVFMLAVAPALINAQERSVGSGPLTLEQVLEAAETRSNSIAGAEAGVRRAEGDQLRARSGRYPQVSGSASYDRALASEFSGVFGGAARPSCRAFTLNAPAPLEARVAEIERAIDCGAVSGSLFGGDTGEEGGVDLPFGRKNTWRFGLAVSQSLYSGGRLGAQTQLAAAGRESADLALTSTRAQFLFDVAQAFYDAALSDRLVAIADSTIGQAEATFKQVQSGFDAGTQPEFELLRARVERDNQMPALIRQRANREIALLRLKQLLDLPPDADLQLAAQLDDAALPPPPVFAPQLAQAEAALSTGATSAPRVVVADVAERTAVREVGAVVKLREAALAAVRAERMPSLSANSSFSQVAYPSSLVPTGDFRTNWTIGAGMQVPILTGGRLRADQVVAQAELDQSRVQLEQAIELAELDTRSAWAELVAAQAAWQAGGATIQQAARAYEIAEVRYKAGVSTQLELSDSRLLLQQSETNRAQAARDVQVARARVALLPHLPLSSAPAGGRVLQQPLTTPRALPVPQQPFGTQPRNAAAQGQSTQPGGRQ